MIESIPLPCPRCKGRGFVYEQIGWQESEKELCECCDGNRVLKEA